jgi:glycosyltransferase involved in cell wall biosynthesis
MNERNYDVVALQHEFGIYGGDEGEWILDLMGRLDAPIVTTLHTVTADPSPRKRSIIEEIGRLSSRIVVLSHAAASRLGPIYGVDPDLVEVIPHGVPDLQFIDPEVRKPEFGLAGRPTLLSFGLLGPGKGFELAIEAMTSVASAVPDSIYVVLGSTHPELRRRHGEQYREWLTALVGKRGLADHVRFVDAYVDQATLGRWLQAADVYVTPYPGAEQVVSGTLAYALGAGKALVSTPYAYARELLANGRGELVPFGDAARLGQAITRFLSDSVARDRARRLAYEHGRGMIWPVVGERYRQVFGDLVRHPRHTPAPVSVRAVASSRHSAPPLLESAR